MSIAVGPFGLEDPLPDMSDARLLIALQPWIDIGSVGTMALSFLEQAWDGKQIAKLSRPGRFYDFSRYRPMLFRRDGERQVVVPNTFLHHARDEHGHDWLFLHALEPHNLGEDYVDGLFGLLKHLDIRDYTMIGSMYAPVPHTRPPVVSGGSSSDALRDRLQRLGAKESNYEGPTTILATLTPMALAESIPAATIILQLPAYAQVERDYRGLLHLLELLSGFYGWQLDLESLRQEADRQRTAMDESAAENLQLQAMVQELERIYDTQAETGEVDDGAELSPGLETFLKDIESRLSEN
jgi:predicted ATP-grasp superfamily ATP-dependent carboligase